MNEKKGHKPSSHGEPQDIAMFFDTNMPDSANRVAIFASYNSEERIADYVVYYLQELCKVVDAIVFVTDNKTTPEELKKIEPYVVFASCFHHGEYDFGSYKRGFVWAERHHLLDSAKELIFCNDSCYGPIFPLKDVFSTMEERPCDFWGLLDSYEDVHHILSFFLVFKKQVFTSPLFCNFVHSFTHLKSFWDYVNKYEKRFTDVLECAGFKSAIYLDVDEATRLRCAYYSGNGNLMTYPLTMLRCKMPLVKVKSLNNVFSTDLCESPILTLAEIKRVNARLYQIIADDLNYRHVTTEDRWLTAAQIVGDAEVVSFDIFDTLLARPYKQPTDLFLHMEEELGRPGFYKMRIAAEAKARKVHADQADVTIGQIYECINKKYTDLINEELRYEHDLLFVKEDGRRIYEEAVRQGKTIVAISDMYLPKRFLTTLLADKGYTAISEVFVSNEDICCKGDGRLFEKVLKKLHIQPSKMVHIGDNAVSDKEAPEKLGIRACLRLQYANMMNSFPPLAKLKCFSHSKGIATSFLTGVMSQHYFEHPLQDIFQEFGYSLGGPLAVGYVQHIYSVAKKRGIDGILFVSRDGYALHEIYKQICPQDIPYYYVQTSRLLVLRNSVDYDVEKHKRKVFEMYAEECLDGQAYSKENYAQHIDSMRRWAEENKLRYTRYLESLDIKGNNLMTVDMTTYEYTSLKILKQFFGHRINCGMFSITFGKPTEETVLSYATRHWLPGEETFLMLQEELITAPEAAAVSITDENRFIYSDWDSTEKARIENYKRILKGIICFANDFKRLTAGHIVNISFEDNWVLAKNYVWVAHYGDKELYKHIYHDDAVEGTYTTLYERIRDLRNNLDDAVYNEAKRNSIKKYKKHLKTIRILAYTLAVETVAIAVLLFLI